jgi:thiol:disulfide interchange protein DsbA
MKIGKNTMKCKIVFLSTAIITTLLLCIPFGDYVQGENMPFPTYGSGAIQVRIYTDYFCPPCRGMEPAVEPLLRNLIKKNAITLTLVDTPFSSQSPLYAKYFLYALNTKNNFEHALKVRNTLFEATNIEHMTTAERIEGLFKSKGIPYQAFEPKPAFNRYNAFIKEDKVDATPTCVIIRSVKKEKYVGGEDIVNALQNMQ